MTQIQVGKGFKCNRFTKGDRHDQSVINAIEKLGGDTFLIKKSGDDFYVNKASVISPVVEKQNLAKGEKDEPKKRLKNVPAISGRGTKNSGRKTTGRPTGNRQKNKNLF